MREVIDAIARRFLRTGCLDVDHPRHPGIDCGDIERAAGFQRHRESGIAQAREKLQAIGLSERLAAGYTDMRCAETANCLDDGVDVSPFAGVEGVLSVAILAAKRATGQAYENGRKTDRIGLA